MIESEYGRAARLGAVGHTVASDDVVPGASDEQINRAVGRAFRDARRASGLTLKQLPPRSGGAFKASAVGGYERGERAISVERFCRLAALYDVSAGDLLGRALRLMRTEVLVDLTTVERAAAQR